MSVVTCSKCGAKFTPPPPQSVSEALLSERRFLDVAPELRHAETAACPRCGHQQSIRTYKFFGFLSPNGVRVVIGLILGGMLAFAIWWNLSR